MKALKLEFFCGCNDWIFKMSSVIPIPAPWWTICSCEMKWNGKADLSVNGIKVYEYKKPNDETFHV